MRGEDVVEDAGSVMTDFSSGMILQQALKSALQKALQSPKFVL